MITHIVSDWLFSPCCVEHQDEFIFERVAVAYSRDYNEVGRAQIKCVWQAVLFSVTLLHFTSLPFSIICKKFCQHHANFCANYVIVSHISKWPTLKNFYHFSVSFTFFNVIFGYFRRKCKNNHHTCLLQCIKISPVSRKQFESSCFHSFQQ